MDTKAKLFTADLLRLQFTKTVKFCSPPHRSKACSLITTQWILVPPPS